MEIIAKTPVSSKAPAADGYWYFDGFDVTQYASHYQRADKAQSTGNRTVDLLIKNH
jgi:hypothetical protein